MIRSCRLRSLQYRFLHRLYYMHDKLFSAGLRDSPNCNFCDKSDNYFHMFWECIASETLWEETFQKLSKYCEISFPLNPVKILLGNFSKRELPALTLSLLVKKEIIAAKWENRLPNVNVVWNKLLHYGRIEKLIAVNNNKIFYFLNQWGELANVL